jgi:ribonuclease Z
MLAVTILGNNSALPMFDRHPTAQVVTTGDRLFLVDCGEGTQIQMNRYKIRRSKIGHIFISHLHGDHYYGLIGLLNSMSLTGREDDLHIFGPPPLKEIIDLQLLHADTSLSFDLFFHPLGEDGILVDDDRISIRCFQVTHRIPCWGFLFQLKKNPRKVDPDRAAAAGIPASFFGKLKKGEDYVKENGECVPNESVTIPAPPGRSYAYCADTRFQPSIAETARNVGLLYHEATYLDDQRSKAHFRFHSTARQAATIAAEANAGRLLLGHFSSKYEMLDAFREEATQVFPNTEVCREGVTYLIP